MKTNFLFLLFVSLSIIFSSCDPKDDEVIPLKTQISVTNASAYNAADGSIDLTVTGGKEPYSYQWSNGESTQDITNLAAGTYFVTVNDANKNTITDTAAITQPDPENLTLAFFLTHVSEFEGNDGAVDIIVDGGVSPYTFSWSNGETTEDISSLTAGDYTIVVTDSENEQIDSTITINEPGYIELSFDVTDVTSFGGNDGAIDMTITGGNAPYTIAWSNDSSDEDLTGISAGIYKVTVTDNNNITAIDSTSVTQPDAAPLVISSTVNYVSEEGLCDGTITIEIVSGEEPFVFSWSNDETTQNLSDLCIGSYTLTISDNAEQSYTETFEITNPQLVDIEGNIYKIVTINEKIWMAENLRVKTTRDDEEIIEGEDGGGFSYTEPQFHEFPHNASGGHEVNPILYNWPAAKEVCPDGWHIPSDDEWQELKGFLAIEGNGGAGTEVGTKLKGSESSSGLNMLFSGFWNPGTFYNNENTTYYWSSTQWDQDARDMWVWKINNETDFTNRVYDKRMAFSVRCVKN